jgi:hypothetical protein
LHYIHLTADDIEPHEGWYEAAVETIKDGFLPAPRILNGDGSLQSCGDANETPNGTVVEIARIPFATKEQMACIGPIIDQMYFTDNWFSHRGRQCGWESVINRAYLFTHHLAPEGRIDTLYDDSRTYWKAVKRTQRRRR